jgi:O-antigen/teichoic acid export membrane protein
MIGSITRLKTRAAHVLRTSPNIVEAIAAAAIKLVGAALSFTFSFMVARTLGAAGTGSFALAQTTALFGSTVALIGLDYVVLRNMAGSVRVGDTATARGFARTATTLVAGAAIIVGAVIAVVGGWLLAANGNANGRDFLLLAGIAVLPLALNRIAVTALRGAGGILAAQWLEGPQAMLLAVAVLGTIILTSASVTAYGVTLLFFVASATTALAAGGLYFVKSRSWDAAAAIPAAPMLRQGWQISFIVLTRMMVDWVTLVALGATHSVAETGMFRTAWQISSLIALVFVTFDTVSGPRIAAAHRVGDTATIRRILRQAVRTMALITAPLFILILGFPEWLLGLFGAEFPGAATALRILALGQLFNIAIGPVGAVLLMTGEERWSARISVAGLGLLALCCLTLVPAYGMNGAALTTTLLILFRAGLQWAIVRRQFRQRA